MNELWVDRPPLVLERYLELTTEVILDGLVDCSFFRIVDCSISPSIVPILFRRGLDIYVILKVSGTHDGGDTKCIHACTYI